MRLSRGVSGEYLGRISEVLERVNREIPESIGPFKGVRGVKEVRGLGGFFLYDGQ